ncbi:hypothetical protein Kpol_513p22 [Vanderwaltozyma polyspora DSM 70294]|uniref:Exonuclease domain-containing protein n=1 Tax=Vanderwaltozyma polyspora (strain ATCC 22028 / DSM 70294 / BCRC 21397 / CBS 2163 / NBRC 10782 / NRRL Y-8283 / UCD 57-17) TaxID=436907 RepID=A7TMK8_VANPO|nr:uncharacterized protein Kpol_513p22 [Vanderwaltozyma polyspora DSM 70294]EDO16506.1 hypothetical protein Kpol_513p22 [Vanderwaltozyma polyspora DSM 70294]
MEISSSEKVQDELKSNGDEVTVAEKLSTTTEAVTQEDVLLDDSLTEMDLNSNRSKRRRSSAGGPLLKTTKSVAETGDDTIRKKKKNNKAVTLQIQEKSLERRISIKDLRDFTLYLLNSTNNSPKWIQVNNRTGIKKMIVLFVPGLLQSDYNLPSGASFHENYTTLQNGNLDVLKDAEFEDQLLNFPVSAPGSRISLFSAYNSFVNVGLTKKEKEDRKAELSKKKITINDILMDINGLIDSDYPIHFETAGITDAMKKELTDLRVKEDDPRWVDTKSFDHDGSHIFALDCEMCMSEDGLVLTRISIVNFDGEVIYDKLVKPDVPIIDYLTKYSGITEEKLADVTTTLKDVQNDILGMISTEDVLIGHSLQSDLSVLKLRHPKIVDTALIFDHKAGPPFKPSLRYLTSEYLNRDIQCNDAAGHDSIEDAKACLELTKMKIVNGLLFGAAINTENLFHRLAKIGTRSLTLIDSAPKQHATKTDDLEMTIRCSTDDEIFDNVVKNVDDYDILVGRLRGLEFAREYAKPSIGRNVEITTEEAAMKTVGEGFKKIYNASPNGTLILMLSGSGDTREWNKIMQELNKLNKEDKNSEKQKRDGEIQDAVSNARDGVASMVLKQDLTSKSE